MTDLGTLDGRQESFAIDINDRGEIVGWSRDWNGNERAVLWQGCAEPVDPSLQQVPGGNGRAQSR